MKIKKLSLVNFKGFAEAAFTFQGLNILKGKNGVGKSAIKDAIIFALYNRTPDGSSQNTDTFIKRGENVAEATLTLDNDHQITRKRSEKGSTIAFVDFSQSDEDARVAQRDIEGTEIPTFDRFINVFNVGYFMTLEEKIQREFILSLTPPIDREQLFREAGGDVKMCLSYEIDPSDFKESFQTAKRERLARKKEKDDLAAKIEFAESKIEEPLKEKSIDELSAAIIDFTRERDEFKSWESYRQKEAALAPVMAKNGELLAELQELDKIRVEVPEEPSRETVRRLEAAINRSVPIQIPVGTCPTCQQMVQEEHRDRIAAENREREAARNAMEKELATEEEKYMALSKARDEKLKEVREINIRRDTLNRSIVEVKGPAIPSFDEPKRDLAAIETEISIYTSNLNYKKDVASLTERLIEIRKELEELELLCNLFSPSGLPSVEAQKKAAPIEIEIQKFYPEAKIVLLRMLKNGMEYKDTFDIELSGKPYARLSAGEKKRLDFVLAITFHKFLKEKGGIVFLDDADLIDKAGLDSITATAQELGLQIFLSHVTEDDKILIN